MHMIVTLVLLLQAAYGQLGSTKMMRLALDVGAVTESELDYSYHVSGFPLGHPKKLYFGVEKRGVSVTASKLVSGVDMLCQKASLIHGDGTKQVKLPCAIERSHDYTLWVAVDEDAKGKNAKMFGNRDFALGDSVRATSMEMKVTKGSVHGFTLDYTMIGHIPGGRLYVAVSKEMSGYNGIKIQDNNNPDTVCWAEIVQKEGHGQHKFSCSLEPGSRYRLYTATANNNAGEGLQEFQSTEFGIESITQTIMVTQKNLNQDGFDFTYQMQNVIKGGRLYIAVTRQGDKATPLEIVDGGGSVLCREEYHQVDEKEHTVRVDCSLEANTHYTLWIAGAIDAQQGGLKMLTHDQFYVPEGGTSGMLKVENVKTSGFDLMYKLNNHVPGGLIYFAVTKEGTHLTPQQISKDEAPVLCFTTYPQVDDKKYAIPWACPLERETKYTIWMAVASDAKHSFLTTVTHLPFKIIEIPETKVWFEVVNVNSNGFDLNYRLDKSIEGGEVCFSVAPGTVNMNSMEVSKDVSSKAYCHLCVSQTPDGQKHTKKMKCKKKLEIGHTYILYSAVSDASQTIWRLAGNKALTVQKILQMVTLRVTDVSMKGFTLHYQMNGSNKGGKMYWMLAETCPSEPMDIIRMVKARTNMPSGVLKQEDDDDHHFHVKGTLEPNRNYKVCVVLDPDGSETQTTLVESNDITASRNPTKQPTHKPTMKICVDNMTFNKKTGHEPCTRCKDCGGEQLTQFECTRTSDRICKKPCVEGQSYSSNGVAPCAPCSSCGGEGLIRRQCTIRRDAVCKDPCDEGMNWSDSGVKPCRPCKNCGSEMNFEQRCMKTQDAVCKEPCEETMTWSNEGVAPCDTCRKCGVDERMVSECRLTRDRVCERLTQIPTPQPTPQPDRTCTEGMDWSMTGDEPCTPCKHCGRYQATTYWCSTMKDSECEDLCPLAPDCSCNVGYNARMRKSSVTGCAECTCEERPPAPTVPNPVVPTIDITNNNHNHNTNNNNNINPVIVNPEPGNGSPTSNQEPGKTTGGGTTTGGSTAGTATEGEGEGAATEGGGASAGGPATEGEGEAGSKGCSEDDDDDDDDDDCGEDGRLATRSSRLSMFGRGGQAKWIWVYALAGVATLLTGALIVKYVRNRRKYNGNHIALDHLLAHDTQL